MLRGDPRGRAVGMGAAYASTIEEFSSTDAYQKLGKLVASVADSGISSQRREQIDAWKQSIQLISELADSLKRQLPESASWHLILEYEIPRRARRPDLIILARDLIFTIEFKMGAVQFHSADRWQARDYALSLRDFHSESKAKKIMPMLVATDATCLPMPDQIGECVQISPVQCVNRFSLLNRIVEIYLKLSDRSGSTINIQNWINSPYRPTPTIVEAAQRLFRDNHVVEISHSFATNSTDTTQTLVRAIEEARDQRIRTICFVTGIPGAGKTLAGLNAAHDPALRADGRATATFLSGNGPLISVIHESLVRDSMSRGSSRQDAEHRVSAFIHDVHRFMRRTWNRQTNGTTSNMS